MKRKVRSLNWFTKNCHMGSNDEFIHPKKHINDKYWFCINKDMQKFCGKEVTIKFSSYENIYYSIEEDSERFSWQDWMFEDENS